MSETLQDSPAEARRWPFVCCSRRGGLVVAAALAVIGLGFTLFSLGLTFGDFALPGPGFFPFALGLVLIALSIAIFVLVFQEPRGVIHVELGHAPVLVTFILMALAAASFERLGAPIALGGFSAAMLVLVARMNVAAAILSSAVGMIAVWYVFKVLLGVQLPVGPLAGIL